MPAISRWSSSADLSGVARSRNSSPISSPLERVAGRLDAEPGEHRMLVQHRLLRKQHEAEAARIVEDDAGRLAGAAFDREDDMVVRRELGALVMEDAGRRRRLRRLRSGTSRTCRDGRSAQAPPSRCTVRYLARRPSAVTRRPVERFGETASGNGKRRSGRRVSTADDPRAFQHRLQAAPDRLDLGKLRHVGDGSGRRMRRGGRRASPRCSATVSPMSAKLRAQADRRRP